MRFRKLGAIAAATLTFGAGGTIAADKQINPYDDKGSHYELSIKSDIPQGERVEIAKDRAAMTIKGWNDEYAITIEPQIPSVTFGAIKKADRPFTTPANRPLLSKKMEFKSGDTTAFIEPKTENEFDIDFTLDSKPDTNVFEYKISGAEDFDFFYQPALTQEEIDEGAERPENVVGSYAVYHKTKANHRVGSTNYATGKAFHIYRPKAIDANGAEVWAELSYVNGLLSVTVPQKFLDEAVYPVRVDPTFGYTTIGGTTSTNTNANADVGATYRYTASSGDIVTDLNIYGDGTGTGSTVIAVYDWNGSVPVNRTGTVNFDPPSSVGWHTSSVSIPLSNGTTYVVAAQRGSGMTNFRVDTIGTASRAISTADPWVETTTLTATYSFYATYTASGGGSSGSSSTPQVIIFE